VIAAAVFAMARSSLTDDAYITLDYARNIAFHLHWGLIPQVTANTATSPLNVLVLAFFTAITRHPVLALGIVFVLSSVALEFGLRRAAKAVGLPGWVGLVAVVLVSVNPLLISSIGLEIALGAGLTGLLVAAAAERRPVLFGVLGGLLVLTRPDLLIVVLVVFALRPGWYVGWWRSVLAFLAVTLPWYVWSWTALGSVIPATLLIKAQERWGPYTFGNGYTLYDRIYPNEIDLSFLPAVLGVVAAVVWLVLRVLRPNGRARRLDRFACLPVAGVLHYLAYTALGVPPYHWYYGPSIACLTAFLAAALVATFAPSADGVLVRLPGFVCGALAVALAVTCVVNYSDGGLPRTSAPITTNWVEPGQYATIGADLHRIAGNRTVASAGEIGAVAYFCDCAMIDKFSDPGLDNDMIVSAEARAGKLKRKLLGWNFHFLRAQKPIVPDLRLIFGGRAQPGALAVWQVSSPWLGHGAIHYLSLLTNPAANHGIT
jgi:hypothetical protein